MCPSSLHLTISVIPTKSEANIDWLFSISFQPIIDIRLSCSYVSDYSFLPILNISPFKIMCISLYAARYAALFHRRFPNPPRPGLPLLALTTTKRTVREREVLPSLRGTSRKRVLKCGHISIINYSNESFEWHWLKWLKIRRTFEIRKYLPPDLECERKRL